MHWLCVLVNARNVRDRAAYEAPGGGAPVGRNDGSDPGDRTDAARPAPRVMERAPATAAQQPTIESAQADFVMF